MPQALQKQQVVCFGELMLRLEPKGFLKVLQANDFKASYTGAEANVAVSLKRLGLDAAFVSKIPDNMVTDAALCRLRQYAVNLDHIIYGGDRLGIYYIERGASQRPSKVLYDRKYSSFSMAKSEEFDWDNIFANASVFHFTGITAALSPDMPGICEEACKAAKRHGITISCDLNYRKNLWSPEDACRTMSKLAKYCDLIIGNEEDAEKTLGIKPDGTDLIGGTLDYAAYERIAEKIHQEYGVSSVAFTLRTSYSASQNGWAGMLYTGGKAYYSKEYIIQLVDRVGGGDSFAAGLLYALETKLHPQEQIEFAVAASCLKQTIEFDFNLSSVEDVQRLMAGDGSGRVQR